MPRIPDRVVNKSAKNTQTVLGVIAVIAGFAGIGALSGGNAVGLLFILGAFGLGWAASKIKTTYDYKGGTGIYK